MAVDPLVQATTSRDNLLALLASITANPKPNYNIEGQSVSWGEYVKMLNDGIEATNKLIAQYQPIMIQTVVI